MNKKRILIVIAILVLGAGSFLAIKYRPSKTLAQASPIASPSEQILGEADTALNVQPQSPVASPSPIPSTSPKKSASPKPHASSTPIVSTPTSTPAASTPTPTPAPTPTPTPARTVTVDIQNLGIYTVDIAENATAFDALINASKKYGFNVTYEYYAGMGNFVTGIGSTIAHDNYFWAFYYNGTSSQVGASTQKLTPGDTTAWKFESF